MAAIEQAGPHRKNPQWFILFRILFNCRFYYPIYTIFFLDAGLSMAQFATLNFIWAVSIVLLEVPSGALADQVGRRRLVVLSAVLMVLEMACLAFLPFHAGGLTFWIFAANRVLSGAAEACASGADEALTYDSLPAEGEDGKSRDDLWRAVQGRLMRLQSIFFVLTMLIGAWVYQASSVNATLAKLGINLEVSRELAMRLPVLLCFLMALACLAVALRFAPAPGEAENSRIAWSALGAAFRGIRKTAQWLVRSPIPLALLIVGLLGDSFMRLFYTIGSQFYRTLGISTEWNGPIGAVAALSGLFFATPIDRLSKYLSPRSIYAVVAGLVMLGFLGLAYPFGKWSLLAAVPFWFGMRLLHFNLSVHLNAHVPPEQRATALSFRGLTMNLAYGVLMQVFGWQSLSVANKHALLAPTEANTDSVFRLSMPVWPWVFLALALAAALAVGRNLPSKNTPQPEPEKQTP